MHEHCKDCHENCIPREEFERVVNGLLAKIAELEARLLKYENPHTPPSMRLGNYPKREKSNRPPGKPIGSNGGTKILGDPDEIVDVRKKDCDKCHVELKEPLGYVAKKIIVIPEVKSKIIEFRLADYGLCRCGIRNIAKHPQCPIEGNASASTLAFVQELRITERLSIGLTLRFLKERFGAEFSPGAIVSFTGRTAEFLKHEHFKLVNKIRNSAVLYIDETGFYINGKRIWMWIFTNGKDVVIAIDKSRGSKVISNMIGEKFRGVVVSDCFSAYLRHQIRYGTRFQKCWAHLLREAKACAQELEEGKALNEELKAIFGSIRSFIDSNPSEELRISEYERLLKSLDSIISREYKEHRLRKLIKRLERYRESWLTCILVPNVEPTNNIAETSLRPHVIIRRLRGTWRSEASVEHHEILGSLASTWHNHGLSPGKQLEKELCAIFSGAK